MLRNGNAKLFSNTCITIGEIVAVFGETATIWAQDDVREFERITTQQYAIESEVQKQDYPELEMTDRYGKARDNMQNARAADDTKTLSYNSLSFK